LAHHFCSLGVGGGKNKETEKKKIKKEKATKDRGEIKGERGEGWKIRIRKILLNEGTNKKKRREEDIFFKRRPEYHWGPWSTTRVIPRFSPC